jgi:hypothetical protein
MKIQFIPVLIRSIFNLYFLLGANVSSAAEEGRIQKVGQAVLEGIS